jgi:DNA helicase-2/ATP-dependent DNA helicase PcrA
LNSCEPSRFISEIDQNYLQFESAHSSGGGRALGGGFGSTRIGGLNNRTSGFTQRPTGNFKSVKDLSGSASSNSSENVALKVGYVVQHGTFGKGKITALEGAGEERKATVFFPQVGSKTLLLRFAKLTVIED